MPPDLLQSGRDPRLETLTRPLQLGLSVGHPRGSTGSIGPFVRLADGRIAFLSASIVLAPHGAKRGDMVHQPGPLHRPVLTGLSRVAELQGFTVPSGTAPNTHDFGCAVLLPGIACIGNVIPPGLPQAGRPLLTVAAPHTLLVGDEIAFVGVGSG